MTAIGPISAVQPVNLFVGPHDARTPPGSGVNPGATVARLTAFQVNAPTGPLSNITVDIAVSSGNLDLGVYDANGVRLASTGSSASPGTGPKTFSLTSSVSLVPGRKYYMAVSVDNGTIALYNYTPPLDVAGLCIYFVAFPLPANLTMPGTAGNFSLFGFLS